MTAGAGPLTTAFPKASSVDSYVEIRRNTLIGAGISLIAHLLILIVMHPPIQPTGDESGKNQPISVELNLEDSRGKKEVASVQPQAAPAQAVAKTPPQKNLTAQRFKPVPPPPQHIIATPQATEIAQPEPQPQRVPVPENNEPPPPGADFSTYTQSRLAQLPRSQGGRAMSAEAAANAERDAVIQRNLQRPGTSGIFEIRSKSAFKAQFSFKGWPGQNRSAARQQIIDVAVEPGDDIDLALVRRMISLIREYYTGDFTWVSDRLDQNVTLSARPKDNEALEAFLMKEFFGPVHNRPAYR